MLQFSDYIDKVQKNQNKDNLLVIYGAGVIGRLTLDALKEKNIKVNYFCDSNSAKWNTEIENTKVISLKDLCELDKNIDIFICYQIFSAYVPSLEKKGFKNLYLSSNLLTDAFCKKNYKGVFSEVKVLRLVDYYKENGMKENYIREGKLNLKSIDIQVTEKCSLKCKDCNNLMQYYQKPKDSEMDVLFKSIHKFMQCITSLDEFRVIGGDPFMNKELYKVVNKLVTYEKCKRVIIYTNAKIIPKGENLACLKNKKVSLDITNYGDSSSAHSRLIELVKKENITFCTFRCTTWLDSGRIMPFSNKNDKELEKQFNNCQQRDLVSLLHGKLYRCPFSANGVNLKAIPQNDSDEVNLIDDNLSISELREQIRKLYYDKKYLTACLYCNGKAQNETLKIPSAIQTKKPLTYEISAK